MNYWVISDTHFGHDKIRECFGRPKDFEKKILKSLKVVREEDVLIHLGDFCIGKDAYWHEKFMSCFEKESYGAKLWLVKGNHDRKTMTWYFDNGWDCIAEQLILNIYGKRILFSHKPMPLGAYDINIHGHLHKKAQHHHPELEDKIEDHNILVAIEHEYKPITLRSIVEGTNV